LGAIERRNLIAVIGMVSVVGIVFGITSPLLNLLLERQNISTSAIGLNSSMMALGTILITPLVPRILARMQATRFLYLCLGISISLLLLMKLWPSFNIWLVLRFLLGGAIAGMFVVSETWINSIATDKNRGRILGIYAACLSAGFGTGPLLIEFTGIDGWMPFVAGGVLIFVAGAVLFFARPTPPSFAHDPTKGFVSYLKASPIAILAGLLYGALETGVFGLMPVFGVRTGLSESAAAQMLTAVALGNILFQVPIGWMADHVDVRKVLAFCAITGVVGGVSLATLAGTMAIWPILVIWGGTITGLYTVGLTILGRQYSGIGLASANAAIISAYGFGSLVSPPVLGFSMDLHNPNGLAYALAAMCIAYLFVLAVLWKKSLH
jgi:MFS family permease